MFTRNQRVYAPTLLYSRPGGGLILLYDLGPDHAVESRRDQSRLIMLYNILKQNIYLPSEHFPKLHSHISQTRSCYMLRLAEYFVIPTLTSILSWDYGTPYPARHVIESTSIGSFKLLLRDYYHRYNR